MAWGPAFLWAAVLFGLSELRGIPEPLEPLAGINDKVVHVLLYTVMGGALAWGRHVGPLRPPHAVLLLAGAAYGALDEWHQSFVPGRTPSLGDWVADAVGVAAGYVALHLLLNRTSAASAASPASSASPGSPASPASRSPRSTRAPGGPSPAPRDPSSRTTSKRD